MFNKRKKKKTEAIRVMEENKNLKCITEVDLLQHIIEGEKAVKLNSITYTAIKEIHFYFQQD